MAKRISRKDWDNVRQFVLEELRTREGNEYRKKHEAIWKTVDRQVYMESQSRTARGDDSGDWRAALELGELSRASEVISADIRRLSFPQTRTWFEAHVNVPPQTLQTQAGPVDIPNVDEQLRQDGRLRALMIQQMRDFGFQSRVDLSVKEALHHGAYPVTLDWETMLGAVKGERVKTLSAPVWKVHSMHNSYPDSSAGVDGHNTFYQGSMIIKAYKPAYQVKKMVSSDPAYPFFNLDKIPNTDTDQQQKDVELVYFYGDLVMARAGEDLLLLNSRVILANEEIIHYQPNPFPFPPVIYNGWERLDVRDPYYVSPIVKFSATQTLGSTLANRFVDLVELHAEPPIVYDSNDPDYSANGGPTIAPGAKTGVKGGGQYQQLEIGDPATVLNGLQFVVGQIEAGTHVDRLRSGVASTTEQTATEVVKQDQRGELSSVDFVSKHEERGLRPALYIMHALNQQLLDRYPFYNQELDAPDFEIATREELPFEVSFEIVGSKGVLGEERRMAQTSAVTAFWMKANPALLKQEALAKEMYQDAGNKAPEKFLNTGQEDNAMQQQFQQILQQLQGEMQKLQEQVQQLTVKEQKTEIDSAKKDLTIAEQKAELALLQEEQRLKDLRNSMIEDSYKQNLQVEKTRSDQVITDRKKELATASESAITKKMDQILAKIAELENEEEPSSKTITIRAPSGGVYTGVMKEEGVEITAPSGATYKGTMREQ